MENFPDYLSCFIHIQFLTHFAMSVTYCYRVNDYGLSKFMFGIVTPIVMVLGSGAFLR